MVTTATTARTISCPVCTNLSLSPLRSRGSRVGRHGGRHLLSSPEEDGADQRSSSGEDGPDEEREVVAPVERGKRAVGRGAEAVCAGGRKADEHREAERTA